MSMLHRSLLFCATFILALFGHEPAMGAGNGNEPTAKEKIKIELFVMSQCPFGVAAEKALLPLVKKHPDRIDFSLYFIAQNEEMKKDEEKMGTPSTTGGGGCSGSPDQGVGPFYSLHGQPEVDEDMRQVVMARHFPKKYIDYILCRADNYKENTGWEQCAEKAGIDSKKVKELVADKAASELFSANIQKAWGLGIGSSPTILINGRRYTGRVESLSLTRAMCSKASDLKDCKTVPACGFDDECFVKGKEGICVNPNTQTARCETAEPTKFLITILSSKDCSSYKMDDFKQITTHYFPAVSYRQVDFSTTEGKALAEKYKVEMLPAMLFSKGIEKSIRFSRVKAALQDKGDIYLMNPMASNSPCKIGPDGKVSQPPPVQK